MCCENKLLVYKTILISICSYEIELWVHASNSYIKIIRKAQSEILICIVNAPCYIANDTLDKDLQINTINNLRKERSNRYYKKLPGHPNLYLDELSQELPTRRQKRKCHIIHS